MMHIFNIPPNIEGGNMWVVVKAYPSLVGGVSNLLIKETSI